MKMHETGLITKWKRKWLDASATTCPSDSKTSHTKLDTFHFVGLFILYGSTILVSIVVFIGETAHGRWRNRHYQLKANDGKQDIGDKIEKSQEEEQCPDDI